jgi:hypothetical protein
MKIRLTLLLLLVVAAFSVPAFARPAAIPGKQAIASPNPALCLATRQIGPYLPFRSGAQDWP